MPSYEVMTMFKDTAYGLLCSITEFVEHERWAISTDHRLDLHGLEQ